MRPRPDDVHEMISGFEGYETSSPWGAFVGGHWQRIGLARGFTAARG